MEWKTVGIVIGITTGFFAIAGPIAKWVIADWFKKAKEIEKLKGEQTKNLLDRFQRDINSLGTKLRSFEQKISDYEKTAIRMQSNIDTIMTLIDSSLKSAEKISVNLDDKIRGHVRTEVLALKDQLLLIRNKRGEQPNGK